MINETARGDLLYKLVAALVFLALAVVSAMVLLTTAGVITTDSFDGRLTILRWPMVEIAGLVWPQRLATGGLALITGLLFISLTLKLFSGRAGTSGWHVLSSDDRGFVAVDTRGIASIAEQAAMSAHGVIDADVTVRGSQSSPVRLRVDIGVYPGANIKRSGLEARESVVEAVEGLIGVDVRDVVVKAHVIAPDVLVRGLR